MSDFDERSGTVPCVTPWGCWWQTVEEVFIEISVAQGTVAKEIKCIFNPKSLKVMIKEEEVINVSPGSFGHCHSSLSLSVGITA